MKVLFSLVISCLFCLTAFCQTAAIKGTLTDSSNNEKLSRRSNRGIKTTRFHPCNIFKERQKWQFSNQ